MQTPLGLKWKNSVQALWKVFTYHETNHLQKNCYEKLKYSTKETE